MDLSNNEWRKLYKLLDRAQKDNKQKLLDGEKSMLAHAADLVFNVLDGIDE